MADERAVLVVGAGISGLTAAFRLAGRGMSVEVIDAASRPGGVIGSDRRDGVLFERGPNSTLDTGPAITQLLDDLAIRDDRLDVSPGAARRFVLRGGRLIPVPASPWAFLRTPLFSGRAKLGLLGEPFAARAPAGAEESVARFVVRRLGTEFLDYAIEPLVAGIYAGDPARLSLEATFPRLHALEQRYGSLIKGQLLGAAGRAKRQAKGKNVAASFSFRGGMQTLTDALVRGLGGVRTGARAVSLRGAPDGGIVATVEENGALTELPARAVVLAVPADRAAALVREFAPGAADALGEIPYAPIATVATAYRRSDVTHPLDGFGFLVPRVEARRILGTLFSSAMFGGRAPEGAVLLTSFVGGQRDPHLAALPREEIAGIVREELGALIGARGLPRFCEVTAWPRAIPQYTLGHLDRIRRADTAGDALPGLFLCASYRGGVSVGDCITSACRTAGAVADHLARRSMPRVD